MVRNYIFKNDYKRMEYLKEIKKPITEKSVIGSNAKNTILKYYKMCL